MFCSCIHTCGHHILALKVIYIQFHIFFNQHDESIYIKSFLMYSTYIQKYNYFVPTVPSNFSLKSWKVHGRISRKRGKAYPAVRITRWVQDRLFLHIILPVWIHFRICLTSFPTHPALHLHLTARSDDRIGN